jgi:hypothetical protein
MAMIDERGRIAGRVNVFDVAAAVTVLILIPVAYGSYLLFRNPTPKLIGITPNRLYQGNHVKMEITGRDLRPFMRVSFNSVQGLSFLINTTSSALVDLPDLDSGVYDVVLYDYRQEVDRLPKALTIMPVPTPQTIDVELDGVFVGLNEASAKELTRGVKFPRSGEAVAEILSVSALEPGRLQLKVGTAVLTVPTREAEVPATLRVRCVAIGNPDGTMSCSSVGTDQSVIIAPDAAIVLPGPHGWVRYQIRSVHAPPTASPIVDVRVRFAGEPELLGAVKIGDTDGGTYAVATSRHATISALGASRALTTSEGAALGGGGSRAIDATVRIPADAVGASWTYHNRTLKAGAPFTFETPRYIVHGQILSVAPSPTVSERR